MIICYHAISRADFARKDYPAALQSTASVLELDMKRAEKGPADALSKFSIVVDYRFMARVHEAMGDRPAALSDTLSALAIATAAAGSGLDKDDWENEKWEIYGNLTEFYDWHRHEASDQDEALKYHRLHIDLARQVLASEVFPSIAAELGLPDRLGPWKGRLWSSLDSFAAYLVHNKDDGAALLIVAEAVGLAAHAVDEKPDDLEWRRKLAGSRTMLGRLQERAHQADAALLTYREVLALAARSFELSPNDLQSLVDLADAYDNIASATATSVEMRKDALGKAIALYGRIVAGDDETDADYARFMLAQDHEALSRMSK